MKFEKEVSTSNTIGGLLGQGSGSSFSNCYISNVTSNDSTITSFVDGTGSTTSQLYNDTNLNTLISTIGSLGKGKTKNGWSESI